ncbi:MAG: hypothetical protein GX894_01745 [Clostridia bacterium]|nr:hypothetical protein [Clostridia bacterium]
MERIYEELDEMLYKTRYILILPVLIALLFFLPVAAEAETPRDLDFKNADLHDVLRALAETEGVNIFVDPSVHGRVTIQLKQVTFREVLTLLAREYRLIVELRDNIYFIAPDPAHLIRIEAEGEFLEIAINNAPLYQVLKEIAALTKKNIVYPPDAYETVTLSLYSVDLRTLLQLLADSAGYELQAEKEIFRFRRKSTALSGDDGLQISYLNGLLTLQAENVDITRVLDAIAREAGVNILYGADVRGPVTLQFRDLPVMTALATLLEANGFLFDRRPDHLYVYRTQAHPNIKIFYDEESKLFSLAIKNAPLNEVLGELAQKAGENLIIYSNVMYMINSVLLDNVTLEEAFTYLLQGTPYIYQKKEKAYIFGDGINLRPETGDLLESRYYQLKHTAVDYVIENLPPHFPRNNILPFRDQNGLLVTAGNKIHELFAGYLQEIDRPENRIATEVIRLKHLKAETAVTLLPSRIPKADILVIKEANALVVTGSAIQISQVRQYIEEIDLQNPLILFEIIVVQLSDRSAFNLGLTEAGEGSADDKTTLSWREGTLQLIVTDTIFPGSAAARMAKATLEAMVREGKAKLWANPQITTLSGHKANFNVTTRYPRTVAITTIVPGTDGTQTETETRLVEVIVGIQVNLLPWVSASREITLEINPRITESAPDSLTGADQTPIPATSERSLEATVRVRDGDPIILGGLIQTQESETVHKIPLLGDIPLLGKLFRYKATNKEETEFVIVITPYLLSGEYANQEAGASSPEKETPASVTVNVELPQSGEAAPGAAAGGAAQPGTDQPDN